MSDFQSRFKGKISLMTKDGIQAQQLPLSSRLPGLPISLPSSHSQQKNNRFLGLNLVKKMGIEVRRNRRDIRARMEMRMEIIGRKVSKRI